MDTIDKELLEFRAKLAVKKLAVMKGTGFIPKDGHNNFSNYDYATASSTFDIVRKAMISAGIAFSAEVESFENYKPEKEGSKSVGTRVWMRYGLTDINTGYTETVRWPGDAHDTGDKGLYKAKTNALKYFCFQTSILPTGEDVENDSPESGDNPPPPPADRYTGKRSGKDFYAGQGKKPGPAPTDNTLKITGALDLNNVNPTQETEPPLTDQLVEAMLGPAAHAPLADAPADDIRRPQTDEEVAAVAKMVDFLQNKFGKPIDYDKVCVTIYTKTKDRPGGFAWPKRVGKLQLAWIDANITLAEVSK